MRRTTILMAISSAAMLVSGDVYGRAARGAEPSSKAGTVLDTASLWRMRIVRETDELVDRSGKVVHGRLATDFENSTRVHSWFKAHPESPSLPDDKWRVVPVPAEKIVRLPAQTPADWMTADFDDSDWARARGPVMGSFFSEDDEWKLILLRGEFEVKDPGAAGDLELSMEFRGGAMVYVNGKEVARLHMPDGKVTPATPAKPYPPSADYCADGFTLPWGRQTSRGNRARLPQEVKDRVAGRTRRAPGVKIPAGSLVKGVNLLAVAIHRAPTPGARHVTRRKGGMSVSGDNWWTRMGLSSIRLTAAKPAAVTANTGRVAGRGFRVWNHSVLQKVRVEDYPDPFSALRPMRISAVRGGTFAAQVVVGDDRAIKGLKAAPSDLKGPGAIPASAVTVRYARKDGPDGAFDSLEEFPPAEVPVRGDGGSTQPIWVTVAVPADAPAGDYAGTLTVSADGAKPVAVPLKVRVSDWKLPPASEFHTHMDFVQSPETLAMVYKVPLWSEEHLKLLDKTFSLLGAMADKTLYITCVRRTHLGNEHAMVRWVRDDEGDLQPDFTIVEKYLDVAMKHLGKIPGVILYCWEPPYSQGHAGGAGKAGKIHDKAILYSMYDPETKEYSANMGPAWGTPEAKEFWKKLSDGIGPVLEKRGIKGSMLFGLVGDHRPTKQAMDDVSNGVPGAKWAVHSHYYCPEWQGYKMGMLIALWGLTYSPADPSRGYGFGWSNPRWVMYYPREMGPGSRLTEYRCKPEAYIGARRNKTPFLAKRLGPRGLGRINADFWPALRDGRGRLKGTLAGRYPEAAWGQLSLNFGVPTVLGKGKNGPLATVRSEAFREAVQEIEVRVYVEKALLDRSAPTVLGGDLIGRCRTALDERIRFANRCATYHGSGDGEIWFIASGWRERAETLYELAAEVKRKYGSRDPVPDLGEDAGAKKK